MRQYLTISEYRDLNGRVPETLPERDLNLLIQLASAKVDSLTFGRLRGSLDFLSTYQSELVKQAIVLQTDYLYEADILSGESDMGNVSSWSITDISMSHDTTPLNDWLSSNSISPLAYELLNLTGLTWRGI